ncbi:MAG: hypothetical protein J6334_02470 [Kiritimatiellae bacterium]|nr:hypothetical protein [Kiritimatiellia bacterium]
MKPALKRITPYLAAAGICIVATFAYAVSQHGKPAVITNRHTVASRVSDILNKKPHLKDEAQRANGPLTLVILKQERQVEAYAPGWDEPKRFAMTGFSGKLGPKLREGDLQIPEGIYGIALLNPNSHYYLSMKVSYPNGFDRAEAKKEGRTDLGGDIMIHGKSATIGCIPIGDDAIEDLFYLVNATGWKKTTVIIAPYDMRSGRDKALEGKVQIGWYPILCDRIEMELKGIGKAKSQASQPL